MCLIDNMAVLKGHLFFILDSVGTELIKLIFIQTFINN